MAIWDFFLKINGVDVATYGLYPVALNGAFDSPPFSYDESQIADHDGPVPTVDDPERGAKDAVEVFELVATNADNLETARDNIAYQLSRKDLALIWGNQPTRQRMGRLNGSVKITPPLGEATITNARCEIPIRYFDPFASETTPTTVSGAAATDLDCVLGTWESWPVVTLTSPSSPLVLTAKDSAGATVASVTMTFPGSPTTVVVDMDARTITVDGTRHDEYLTAGDFFPLDPRNGDRDTNLPTIRSSSGAISAVYDKRWM